jgi:alpha-beta hydrolase superfamily lysophospholipase
MAETTNAPEDEQEPSFRGFTVDSAGAPLAFARWGMPTPRGRVVIAHGYGEHGERYRHTARWLNRQGWSVSALDQRGFGRSGGVRGDVPEIKGPVEDLAWFLRQERTHDLESQGGDAPARPQILLGHSFGGLVALLALLWHPDTLDGLIVSSPAIKLKPFPLPLRMLHKMMLCLAPHRPLNVPGDKSQVCSDPVLVQRYQEDPLCHRYISAAFIAAFDQGREELLPFGAELDRPILLLEAGADTLIDPGGAERLWQAVRPGLLERHRLEGFFHEIFHDLGRAEAERLTDQWLDRHFPVASATPPLPCPL